MIFSNISVLILNYIIGFLILLIGLTIGWLVYKKGALGFREGVGIGYLYFICGPVLQVMVLGQIVSPDLKLPELSMTSPSVALVYILLFGFFTLSVICLEPGKREKPLSFYHKNNSPKSYAVLHLIGYVLASAYIFIESEKYLGGHWIENYDILYSNSMAAVLVGNIYNVLRISLPGVVIYLVLRGNLKRNSALTLLFAFCVLELIISSNRILLLFAGIAALVVVRARWWKWVAALILISPLVLQFNSIFPVVRGLIWMERPSIESVQAAFSLAYEFHDKDGDPLGRAMSSAFESSNLQVIEYVVESYGFNKPYLWGETMLLKSAAFFIPRSIWADKPQSFGPRLGYDITGSTSLALNATIVGESFANFGWFGVFIHATLMLIYWFAFRGFHSPLTQFIAFFVAIAAWRFEYAFYTIGIFVVSLLAMSEKVLRSLRFGGRGAAVNV